MDRSPDICPRARHSKQANKAASTGRTPEARTPLNPRAETHRQGRWWSKHETQQTLAAAAVPARAVEPGRRLLRFLGVLLRDAIANTTDGQSQPARTVQSSAGVCAGLLCVSPSSRRPTTSKRTASSPRRQQTASMPQQDAGWGLSKRRALDLAEPPCRRVTGLLDSLLSSASQNSTRVRQKPQGCWPGRKCWV